MKLEIGHFSVRDVRFGEETALADGILTVNREEAIAELNKDKKLKNVELHIVHPGDSVRIIPAKAMCAVRYRPDGRCLFPGYTGEVSQAGEGLIYALDGVGVLAAGLSTVVSLVLTSASSVAKDIYEDYVGNRRGKENVDSKKSILISRIVTGVVMLLVAVGTMYPPDFVWELSTMSAGAMGAAFTAPLILGLYWKRATKQGCYAAVIVGVLTSIVWYLAGLSNIVHSFVPGTIVSFILLVVVSLCTKPMDKDIVDVFFEPRCSKAKIAAAIEGGRKN